MAHHHLNCRKTKLVKSANVIRPKCCPVGLSKFSPCSDATNDDKQHDGRCEKEDKLNEVHRHSAERKRRRRKRTASLVERRQSQESLLAFKSLPLVDADTKQQIRSNAPQLAVDLLEAIREKSPVRLEQVVCCGGAGGGGAEADTVARCHVAVGICHQQVDLSATRQAVNHRHRHRQRARRRCCCQQLKARRVEKVHFGHDDEERQYDRPPPGHLEANERPKRNQTTTTTMTPDLLENDPPTTSKRHEEEPNKRKCNNSSGRLISIDKTLLSSSSFDRNSASSQPNLNQLNLSNQVDKKSIVSHFAESLFFNEPSYETGTLATSEAELSEYGDEEEEQQSESVKAKPKVKKKKMTMRMARKTLKNDEDDEFETLNEQATGGFAADKTYKFGKHLPVGGQTDTSKRSRITNRPIRLLERQSRAILSSYELSSPPIVPSTPVRYQSNDTLLGPTKLPVSLADAQEKTLEDAPKQQPKIQQQQHHRQANAITFQQPKRRPKIGYLPFPSFSFGTTTTTLADTRTSSAFSDSYDALSASSRAKLANSNGSGKKKRPPIGRGDSQCRSLRVAMENLKVLVERNLVASLIGVYILVSLAIIIVLMLPYLFNFQSNRFAGALVEVGDQTSSVASQPALLLASSAFKQMSNTRESKGTQTPNRLADRPHQQTRQMQVSSSSNSETSRAIEGQNSKSESKSGSTNSLNNRQQAAEDVENQRKGPTGNGNEDQARRQRLITRLHQLRAEAKAREIENLQTLWRVAHRRSCQPLKVPFCGRTVASMLSSNQHQSAFAQGGDSQGTAHLGVAYDKTMLPNQFTNAKQSQVERALERYEPLVDVRCYALMPLFLCSIYAPKCVQVNSSSLIVNVQSFAADQPPEDPPADDYFDEYFTPPPPPSSQNRTSSSKASNNEGKWARLVPPCRSLCKEAFRRCTFFLEVLSLKLFSLEDCDSLPESGDADVCVGHREMGLLQKKQENQKCGDEEFKCLAGGACIPKKWRCDGFADCKDKSDEENCSKCEAASQFYCGQDVCISKRQVCDGRVDCKDGRDERLCIRLASTSSLAGNKRGLRRLESWNSSISSWLPVCGASWQATPMSHEACRALGYSQANETLILFGQEGATTPPLPPPTSRANHSRRFTRIRRSEIKNNVSSSWSTGSADQSPRVQVNETNRLTSPRGPEAGPETPTVAVAQLEPIKGQPLVVMANNHPKMDSIARLLNSGPQLGCEDRPAHLVSTVHLQCHDFQCGLSVTSYLSRVNMLQQQPSQLASLASGPPQTLSVPAKRMGGERHSQKQIAEEDDRYDVEEDDYEKQTFNSLDETFQTDQDYERNIELELKRLDKMSPTSFSTYERQTQRGNGVNYASNSPVSSRLVVGGIESMPGEFPYLAALHGGPDEVFFCGGVLISSNWLLTAAHCVGNRTRPDGWMVKVGVTRRIASPAFVKKLRVRQIIKHPEFNQGTHLNNDIALILMDESVEFNQYLRPICLPANNLRLGPDNSKDCVVVGFGKSKFSQDANYLHAAHFVNVPIIHQSVCTSWYAEQEVNLTEGMLCAGYSEGKRDACQGDSGSGLFCRYANTNQFYVAGVVSFGIKCAKPRLPGVYTSVPFYVDWIKETTRASDHPIY